jgi:hypothetical protein
MTLFVLFVSVPAFLFCCLALMHFQQEILKDEGAAAPAGKRIYLDPPGGQLSEFVPSPDPLVSRSDSRTQGEVYQLESAHLGPFFVVRAGNGRDWQFTNTSDGHHVVPSLARR